MSVEKLASQRRSWKRFSLRTVLLAVLLLAIVFGWIGRSLSNARQQRIAELGVQQLGGQIYQRRKASFPPDWLISIFGHETFGTTFKVAFKNRQLTNQDLEKLCSHLAQLPDLELVNFNNAGITDAGLVYLGQLQLPGGLGIYSCPITDAGLTHLKKLSSAQELWLVRTSVTEQGVAQLAEAFPECAIMYDADGEIGHEQMSEHFEKRGPYVGTK